MPGAERADNTGEPLRLHPPYQDLLRAIGRLLDQEDWRDLLLLERPAGLVLHGVRAGTRGEEVAMRFLAPVDLHHLVAAARRQRAQGGRAAVAVRLPVWRQACTYEGRLRALGWLSDANGLSRLRIREDGDALLLAGSLGSAAVPVRGAWFGREEVGRLLHRMVSLRQAGR